MKSRTSLAVVLLLATLAAGCGFYAHTGASDSPTALLSLVSLRSQSGKSYFAVSLRLPGGASYSRARLSLGFPKGSVESVEATPAGATIARVLPSSITWKIDDTTSPSIIGPFVVRASNPDSKPEWAKFSWTGGEVRTFQVTERVGGAATGYGVLRPTPTTSRILIGHESEITAYAIGGGIEGQIDIIALKDAVDPPPPDAAIEQRVEVAAFSVTMAPDKPYLVGMELPAPRPLPPLAKLRVVRAPLDPPDRPLEPATFAGRVSADGSRVLVPVAGSGRYKAYIDSADYRAGRAKLAVEVLGLAQEIRVRLQGASRASESAMAPAFAALGYAPALEILAKDAPSSSGYQNASPLTDTAWTGPLLCSVQACVGSTFWRPAVVCDPSYGNVGCLDIVPAGADAGLTVGAGEKRADICANRLCFVPGKALSDNRGVEPGRSDPVVFAVVGDELLSYSGDAVA